MASTEFGTSSSQARKVWSRRLAEESISTTFFRRFAGRGEDSIIQILTELEEGPGDQIRYDLRVQDRTDGVHGDSQLAGFETPITFYQDSVLIDQLRKAHEFRGMSNQRTVHDLRMAAKNSLASWYRWVFDGLMFAYLAGVAGDHAENVSTILGAGGFAGNALQTADSAHVYDHTGTGGMELDAIDYAVEKAKTVNPKVEPIMVDGRPKYVLVMTPYAETSLKQDAAAVRSFTALHEQASVRGQQNPLYQGALGEYNGVVLYSSEYVPHSTAASDTSYNVLLGRQAGVFAMGNAKKRRGRRQAGQFFNWVEDLRDYDNIEGIGVASCFGIKKARYNSADFGVMQILTADTPAT